jgi:hypothetical protein
MMSSHLVLPREGHVCQLLFQVFARLKKHHNAEMVHDPSNPVTDEFAFDKKDWTLRELGHVQGKEELPPNMPKPGGQGFTIHAKVVADNSADSVTRRSRTHDRGCHATGVVTIITG